ncbi:MAG TPA: hypothetical protein VIZ17_19395 [Acetobacteraceae bacterium]
MQPLVSLFLLFLLYLLFAGQITAPELTAAALTALAAAAYHLNIRRHAHRHFRFSAPWPRLARRIAFTLARDIALVGWGLIHTIAGHPPRAGEARQPFEPGGLTEPAAGHRAIAVLAASVAPNSYVIEVLEPPAGLLMHHLVPRPPAPDRKWPV